MTPRSVPRARPDSLSWSEVVPVERHKKLAILVGGGPAPGINSVIGAATIRAALEGMDVVGVRDGFEGLMQGDIEHITPLTIDAVSRIHFRGGSHIGISRANPTSDPRFLENVVISLLRLDVTGLLTIGGDDTAFSAMKVEERAGGRIHVVHVPKTIDNDLDLPPIGRHVRFPDRPPPRRRDRQEPDGGREDHVAVVFRHHDGPQGRPSRARDRQGGRRDAHPDSGGVPEAAPDEDDRRHARRRDHQAAQLRTAGRRRDDCRRRRARRRARRSVVAPRSRARRPRAHPDRRGEHRRDSQGAGRGAAEGAGRQGDARRQEHRLRAPLRRPDSVRHGIHPRPGLLRGEISARRAATRR